MGCIYVICILNSLVDYRNLMHGFITLSDTTSFEPRCEKNRSLGFQTRSDTNQAVQLLDMARGLKFRIQDAEVLYYPDSENKGADQFRGHREADLRLCFRTC